jgi:ATP-dependent protease HslVU (ClpYQ) peptidase subunit
MTCIVACVENGAVHMAADSGASAWGYTDCQVRRDPKVFKLGEAVIGFTSSWRMGQILRYDFKLPDIPEHCDLHEYMVRIFVPKLREVAKAAGGLTTKEGVEQLGRFLFGLRGRLFYVDIDFQVGEMLTDYLSVGSGAEVAHGALFATKGLPAQQRLTTALAAATEHCVAIREPYIFASTTTHRDTVAKEHTCP